MNQETRKVKLPLKKKNKLTKAKGIRDKMVTKQIDPLYKKVLNISVPNTMASNIYTEKQKQKTKQDDREFGTSTIVTGNLNISLRREQMKR